MPNCSCSPRVEATGKAACTEEAELSAAIKATTPSTAQASHLEFGARKGLISVSLGLCAHHILQDQGGDHAASRSTPGRVDACIRHRKVHHASPARLTASHRTLCREEIHGVGLLDTSAQAIARSCYRTKRAEGMTLASQEFASDPNLRRLPFRVVQGA